MRGVEEGDNRRFAAFLCYASASDKTFARELEAFLESFHTFAEQLPELQICRDGSDFRLAELDARDVDGVLEHHLSRCDHLIVLCSSESRANQYVLKEIAWWIENHGTTNIFLAVTEGNDPVGAPTTVFAPQLIECGLHHRMWFDLRAWRGKEPKGAIGVRDFDDARTALAAELHRKAPGELAPVWQRELARQRRVRRRTRIGIGLLAVALTAASAIGVTVHKTDKTEAERDHRIQRVTALFEQGIERLRTGDVVGALPPLASAEQLASIEPPVPTDASRTLDEILRAGPRLVLAVMTLMLDAGSRTLDARVFSKQLILVQWQLGARVFDSDTGEELAGPFAADDCPVTRGVLATDKPFALVACERRSKGHPAEADLHGIDITGKQILPKLHIAGKVDELAVAADGSVGLVGADYHRTSRAQVAVLHLATGQQRPLAIEGTPIHVALAPDGSRVAVVIRRKSDRQVVVRLFNAATAEVIGEDLDGTTVHFTEDSVALAVWSENDKGFQLWRAENAQAIGAQMGRGRPIINIHALSVSRVFALHDDGNAEHIDVNAGTSVTIPCGSWATWLTHDRAGTRLACVGDSAIGVWGIPDARRVAFPIRLSVQAHRVMFFDDGRRVLVQARAGVTIWEVESTASSARLIVGTGEPAIAIATLGTDGATVFAVRGEKKSPKKLSGWRLGSVSSRWTVDLAFDPVALHSAPDMIGILGDNFIEFRGASDGAFVKRVPESDEATSVAMSPNGLYFAATNDSTVLMGYTRAAAPPPLPAKETPGELVVSDEGLVAVLLGNNAHVYDSRTQTEIADLTAMGDSSCIRFDGEELHAMTTVLGPVGQGGWTWRRGTSASPFAAPAATRMVELPPVTPGDPQTCAIEDMQTRAVDLLTTPLRPIPYGDTEDIRAQLMPDGTLATLHDGVLMRWNARGEALGPGLSPNGNNSLGFATKKISTSTQYIAWSGSEIMVWKDLPLQRTLARPFEIATLDASVITPTGTIPITNTMLSTFLISFLAANGNPTAQLVATLLTGQGDTAAMFDAQPKLCQATLANRESLLEVAVRKSPLDAIRVVIEKCGDLEHRDVFGNTAVWFSLQAGRTDVTNLLIAHGAKLPDRSEVSDIATP